MEKSIFDGVEGVLLDLDGTLYVGGTMIPTTPTFIEALQNKKMPFLCVTNNSSSNKGFYVDRLQKMGLAVEDKHVMTSGEAAIHFLHERTDHRTAYVVGTPTLCKDFEESGIGLDAENPDCVVVAYDKTLTYEKLCIATRLLFSGKPYYATHPDQTCLSEEGLLPDIAAITAGLEAVTGRRPEILGKPYAPIVEACEARLGIARKKLAMVGDQLDTDMTMAVNHGLRAILVLSGEVTDAEAVEQSPIQPDLTVDHVGELAELLTRATAFPR